MNENGSSTLLGIAITLIISIVGLTLLSNRIDQFKDLKDKQKLLLCSKEVNGKTTNYIRSIQRTNKTLKVLTIGKHLSSIVPFPGLNIASKIGIATSIKLLKGFQIAKTFSYTKYLITTKLNKCSINNFALTTPFKHIALFFSRDKFNQAKLRKKKWTIKTKNGRYQITSIFYLKKVSSKIKKVNFYSRYLSF